MVQISRVLNSCILFFLTATSVFGQEAGFPFIRNYTPKEYNGAPQVFAIVQDRETGLMYFEGGDKMLQYDGVVWKEIPARNKTGAYSIVQHEDGRIYIAAIDDFGYLEVNSNGKAEYFSLTHLIGDSTWRIGNVWSVRTTRTAVYFQTFDAIFEYQPGKEELKIIKAPDNGRFQGGFSHEEQYYVWLVNEGLMLVKQGRLVKVARGNTLRSRNHLRDAVHYEGTRFLVPTRNDGIFLFDIATDSLPVLFPLRDTDFLKDNPLYVAYPVDDNILALGSRKKGVALIDKSGAVLQSYNEDNLLQINAVLTVFKDNNQNLWLGLDNGISKTQFQKDLTYWDKSNGLRGSVESVIRYKGSIYVATSEHVYRMDKDNRLHIIRDIPTGQNWNFLKFASPGAPESDTQLLAGTQEGVFVIEGDRAKQIFSGSHALVLYQSRIIPERVFTTDGVTDFVSLRYVKGKWKVEGKVQGVRDYIKGIAEDENGVIWLGTANNGVIRIEPELGDISRPRSVRYLNTKHGLPSNNDCLPFHYNDKVIWTTEKGLFVYNVPAGMFDRYCGLGDEFCDGRRSVSFLLADSVNKRVFIPPWSNKDEDIGYLQFDAGGKPEWKYQAFKRLPEMAYVSSWYTESNGVIWIGGNEGLFRYDPSMDKKNYDAPFRCLIREVKVKTDSVISHGDSFSEKMQVRQLGYDLNTLKFRFAAPFFDQEEKTLYSYRLEGFDKQWSEWGRQTEKEYTNLREGTYRFIVRARNIYDVESQAGVFEFRIMPPVYRTWYAYTAYVILGMLMLAGLVGLYTRQLRERKQYLEHVIRERTAEINDQNRQLKDLNATKDKFFSIISHDLKGPLHSISSFINLMLNHQGKFTDEEIHMLARDLDKSMKNLYTLLDNLLEWANMQTGVMDFTPESFDLTEVLQQTRELLESQAAAKQITIKTMVNFPCHVRANRNSVATVFRNLLSNAIKFSHPGGTINVEANITETEAIVSIQDTGVGMPHDIVAKLFKLGTKVTTMGTAREKGTGLGLILCREFIEKNNGRIWVESEEGAGSVFCFSLPLSHSLLGQDNLESKGLSASFQE